MVIFIYSGMNLVVLLIFCLNVCNLLWVLVLKWLMLFLFIRWIVLEVRYMLLCMLFMVFVGICENVL